MARLSRAETQERNRRTVLVAARAEFAERGYRDAKVDLIAERAELTRGAVYSNFPSKRALYLAVLADDAIYAAEPPDPQRGRTVTEALGAFARAWVSRPRIGSELIGEILADDRIRRPFAQLLRMNALLLGNALEHLRPPNRTPGAPPARLVRLAETVLTTLHGASQLAVAAPGFVEPFDVVSACERLAGLALNDFWSPPDTVPAIQPADAAWSPPKIAHLVSGEPVRPTVNGVVAVLGLHRVAALEQAMRADVELSVVLVTSDARELMPLARLMIGELLGCLRQSVTKLAWPRVHIVYDDTGVISASAGVLAVSDETEIAIRVADGRMVAKAEGPGACHAVAARDRARVT